MICLDCDEVAQLMEAMEIDTGCARSAQQHRMDIAAQRALDEAVAMFGDAMTMPVIRLLRGVLDKAGAIADEEMEKGMDN